MVVLAILLPMQWLNVMNAMKNTDLEVHACRVMF
jgi:hypothetical protein